MHAASYTVLTIETDTAHAAALAERMEAELGRSVVQVERAPAREVWLEVYFEDPAEAARALPAWKGRRHVQAAALRRCEARDWQSFWRHHFHAHNIGRTLRIVPMWEREARAPKGRHKLVLDPGLSFGTGEHFTTRFCLEMIEHLCEKRQPRSLLDVGTGSGILAVAALRLGIPRVTAFDNDAQAVAHAEENLRLNRLAGRARLEVRDLARGLPRPRHEVVCANVYGLVLQEWAPVIARGVGRWLVASGIREAELDGVAMAYEAQGGREIARDGDGQWGGLVLEWKRN